MQRFLSGNCLFWVGGQITSLHQALCFSTAQLPKTADRVWLRKRLFLWEGQLRQSGKAAEHMGYVLCQWKLDTYLWSRHGEPPFTGGRVKQCIPPPLCASMWNSSRESCSRNACSLAVIIRRAWTSSSSAAIWSRRKWIHCFESRNRRLYVLLVSRFWWQYRKNKASEASMVSEFPSGRCFISYNRAQISRVTQDTMLWKIKLKLPFQIAFLFGTSQCYTSRTLKTSKGSLHKEMWSVFQRNHPRIPKVVNQFVFH